MWQEHKQNLHIHTRYCDGNDTPEEMTVQAIQMGFNSIGISPHSYSPWDSSHDVFLTSGKKIDFDAMPFGPDPHMWPEYAARLQEDIRRLNEQYGDKIRVFSGLEWDVATPFDPTGLDYVIGACHFLSFDGEMVSYQGRVQEDDGSIVPMEKWLIRHRFGGDRLALVKKYYSDFTEMLSRGHADIIGHFDCIANSNEKHGVFDTDDREYRKLALEALYAIAEKTSVFEVNTGAITYGDRYLPNPDPFILKELKRIGGQVLITSDCHDKAHLHDGYALAVELLKICGFDEITVLTENGFCGMKI